MKGLIGRGWIEGQNLILEHRWAEGRNERLPALAAELVHRKVDVIVAVAEAAALAAKDATKSVPVVILLVADPVESKLVASLARPGGNVTGMTFTYKVGDRRAERRLAVETRFPSRQIVFVEGLSVERCKGRTFARIDDNDKVVPRDVSSRRRLSGNINTPLKDIVVHGAREVESFAGAAGRCENVINSEKMHALSPPRRRMARLSPYARAERPALDAPGLPGGESGVATGADRVF
ncbi:MAG TPA: ABC transporter substrate binding protein [Gemmatimonadales bacterium]|nr:ABC transporter substrate binding protein [Gemmatimonadales bacterium]